MRKIGRKVSELSIKNMRKEKNLCRKPRCYFEPLQIAMNRYSLNWCVSALVVSGFSICILSGEEYQVVSEDGRVVEVIDSIGGTPEQQRSALVEIFRRPNRYQEADIGNQVLRLWREAEDLKVRYYALRAYARLKGEEALPLIEEALVSEESLLRAVGAYGVFELESSTENFERMINEAVDVSYEALKEEIFHLSRSYLRREWAFSAAREWPSANLDLDEYFRLLRNELLDAESFWKENEIRKNLRMITEIVRQYRNENRVRHVSAEVLVNEGYLEEFPESVAGEDYSRVIVRYDAIGVSVETAEGKVITYWR